MPRTFSSATAAALFGAALALHGAPAADAASILTARLTNDQEVPPVTVTGRPVSFGDAVLRFNADRTALTFTVNVFNIDVTGSQTPTVDGDNLTLAHIHRAPPGVNGPVVFGFFGTPINDTAGAAVPVPFSTGVGGTFTATWDASEGNNTTLTAEIANILAGRTYFNIHTVDFRGGEIRGQIVVPGPGALGAFAVGLFGIAASLARGRAKA